MKSFVRVFGVVAGMAALLVSCNKQEAVFVPEDKTVEMTIVASSDETKTVLGSDGTVTWLASGEQLAVMEVAISGTETTTAKETSSDGVTNDEGATMTFGVSMTTKEADSFGYYALYPNSAYVSNKNTNVEKFKVELVSTQTPTEFSFGSSADVLVAKPVTGLTEQPTKLNLQFARVIAVGKMTINNLNTAENVKKVTFTAAGKAVTGRSYINLTTAAGGGIYGGVDNVVLDYSGKTIAANGMDAYFTCWPFELGAGDTFSVVVETENYTFTKNITLAEGKSLAFKVGRASAFNVNFTGIEGVKKEQTWTWTAASKEDLGTSKSYSATLNEKAWTVTRSEVVYTGFSSSCIQLGSKSGAETVTLTSNAFTGTVKSVAVECSSYNGAHTVDITVGGTSYASKVSTDSWTTVGTVSGTGTSSGEIVIKFNAGSRALYIKSISVTYAASGSSEGGSDPVKLATPSVSCNAKTANSLTFSWKAVANASDYQVSTDGGTTYSSTQNATSYTWTGLSASTSYTLYVKAIGDGINFADSDAASAEGKTTSGDTPSDYTFATSQSASNTAYSTNYDVTISDIQWSVPGNQQFSGYVRIGGKSLSSTVRYIYSKTALPVGYKTIKISTNGISNSSLSVESVVCKVYSSATGAENGGESDLIATMTNTDDDWAVSTAKTIVFTDESSAAGSARFYRFEFTLTNSTSKNYGIDLQKIVFSAN